MDPELSKVADNLAQQLLECLGHSTSWLVQAGKILGDYQRRTTFGQMTAIHNSRRLPWGQRYCQVLSVLARNPVLHDPKLLQRLPSSIAALEVISTHLDQALIEEGLRNGMVHRGLTRKAALAAARKMRTQALLKNPTLNLP
jgi:hypothetical protein